MKIISKYSFLATLTVIIAVGLLACNDDKSLDEWNDITYVYVKGQTLGNDWSANYTVVETVGFEQEQPKIDYNFNICLNKPASGNITVMLNTSIADAPDADESTIALSAKSVTIPAGELLSEELLCTIDPAFLAKNDALGNYNPSYFKVMIDRVEPENKKVKASTKTNAVTIKLNKVVKPYLNIKANLPANSAAMNRSDWICSKQEDIEGNPDVLKGAASGDIASNTAPWWVMVDMGAEFVISGAQTRHWASSYAPRQIEIKTSLDGINWKSQGIYNTLGSTQRWQFIKHVNCRFLKYSVLSPNTRTDITALYLYVPNV